MFYYTPDYQTDVVIKKTEIYDGATPSGNSIMTIVLHYLSLIFDKPEWKLQSEKMLRNIVSATVKYPTSFGVWAIAYQEMSQGINEIIVTGEDAINLLYKLQKNFIGNKVIQATIQPSR